MTGENKLSDKKLRPLLGKHRDSQVMMADGKGMSIRVSKNGHLSFVYQFRLSGKDKNTIWLTLGKYPDLSLSAARKKRDTCRSWLAEGKDPRLQIKIAIRDSGEITVKNAIDFWFDNYARKKRKLWANTFYRIEKHIVSKIGDNPLKSITNDMWFGLFDEVSKTSPVAARMLFQEIRQAIRFCNLKRYTNYTILNDFYSHEIGEASQKRSRFLSNEELKDLWFYANRETNNKYFQPEMVRLICISMVFGCRISEAIDSVWAEWDLDKWIWTVPENHSKNGEKIVRPIPFGIRNWILALKQVTECDRSILGGELTQPKASNRTEGVWEKMGHKERWTLHDLRRTLATHLCDLGVEHYVIEQLLGHTLPGVMGIYNRSQQIEKKLEALNKWVNYLDALLGEEMLKIIGRDDLEKMPEIDRIIREDECKWLTSLSWRLRRDLEDKGMFPKKIPISPNYIGYRLSEVQAWIKGTWKSE
ncbi:integrase arm-type DNA-binding domain-containing protein [Arsenophonus nasoniae]|uniref:Integrase arm-type DNA-binding domain-containing protein n=1 Tax=Arsenophonus nasoniae TaxID=638 RepID=A0AA95GH38_9GAMM|nr:integrase arm-type DNA-binding domain-containing protein [Arsenophonus nasoniae]WGL95809.1 integrase arm-type DNA-binding domain-containing protein [Arsenophonus nasoniae]